MDNNTNEKKNIPIIISLILFFIIMGAGLIVGFIIPIRPKVSEMEQRELTKLPSASVKTVLNGDYFSGVSLWYADSFPMREEMITIDDQVKNLYGVKTSTQIIGTSVVADEIPDIVADGDNAKPYEEDFSDYDFDDDFLDEENPDSDSPSDNSIPDEPDNDPSDMAGTRPDDVHVSAPEKEITPPDSKKMEAEIKKYIQQSLYVKDGAAHSLYYFSLKAAESYAAVMNHAGEELDGICNVYNILVPNSSGVVLSDEELASLGGSNQADAVHYYYSLYDKATGIESVDVLREHNDEYLFFRTDHHWTALGAYYVYTNYCKEKGWTPHALDYYEQVTFEPFLGSYYSSLKNSAMAANPDYVTAYIPHGTNDMQYFTNSGKATDYDVIHDVSSWSKFTKYNCFIGGDQPMQKIVNPGIHNKSACLVIKESYGNCFVPFLVDHYNTVYVMDYRYCNKNAISFIKENGIDDLIVVNNISIIGSKGVRAKLSKMLSE